jgi:hypothetical protein
MFAINHAATALVLKSRYPTVRMAFILLAVQAVELLWVALNLLGIEITTTDDTVRSVQNIHLLHMPWSHSIATTLVFAIVAWMLIRFAVGKPKTAIAVALGIASHLVLDLVTHSPDIAIAPGLETNKLGVGFYGGVPVLAFLLELGFGIACWRVYRGSRWLLLAIIGFNVANVSMFFPQVVGIEAKLAGQATVLTLVILAQIVATLAMVGWLSCTPTVAQNTSRDRRLDRLHRRDPRRRRLTTRLAQRRAVSPPNTASPTCHVVTPSPTALTTPATS